MGFLEKNLVDKKAPLVPCSLLRQLGGRTLAHRPGYESRSPITGQGRWDFKLQFRSADQVSHVHSMQLSRRDVGCVVGDRRRLVFCHRERRVDVADCRNRSKRRSRPLPRGHRSRHADRRTRISTTAIAARQTHCPAIGPYRPSRYGCQHP